MKEIRSDWIECKEPYKLKTKEKDMDLTNKEREERILAHTKKLSAEMVEIEQGWHKQWEETHEWFIENRGDNS
jgi:hypothetical protein